MIDDSTVFSLTAHYRLQWEEVQNCHVLLYPEGMIKLNSTAAAVLTLVDGTNNVVDIITSLQKQFPGESLELDVKKLLGDADEHGWIVKNKR